MTNAANIQYLFEPRSVAVIGASADAGKIGHSVLKNMQQGGYRGALYPVNPRGGMILNLPVFEDITAIREEVDLAVIVVPARQVFDAVRKCASKGVKTAIVISSGFSETGNSREEEEIARFARSQGLRILGPNVFGIYSASASLNCTFGPEHVSPGNVAILTQSGALGLAMIGKTEVENIGLSAMVSIGNKSDIDEADLLTYLRDQESTRIILMYMEGVKDGERLCRALVEMTRRKPVIVIKSGRSEKGAIAAASHTGSLAGSDDVFDHLMRQCGVLRAESLEEAFNWCRFMVSTPLPGGENTLIITNGGGVGVLAADACEKYRVKLYDDTARLEKIFKSILPDFGSTKNPVDLTGQAGGSHYDRAFDSALRDKGIHSVISLYCETDLFEQKEFSKIIARNTRRYQRAGKPIVFCLIGGREIDKMIRRLERKGIAASSDVYGAVSSLGAMYGYFRYLAESHDEAPVPDIDTRAIDEIVEKVRGEGRFFLLAAEAQKIMGIAGIPMPRSTVARQLNEAVQCSQEIGYPVVMKISSKDIIHKSDIGGVALDLENEKEVIDAYQAIMRSVRLNAPAASIDGVEITKMIEPGVEIIAGARVDRSFGPLLMVGLGGIYVEVMKDVSFRACPAGQKEILKMIKELKSYPLLLGVRGEKTKDIASVIDTLTRLGTVIERCTGISDIEVNPLMVYEQNRGAFAVDARILLEKK